MTLFGRLAWDLRAAVRARLIYWTRTSLAMATRRRPDLADRRVAGSFGREVRCVRRGLATDWRAA